MTTSKPKGMTLTADGYLRIKTRGPYRDKMAHRVYVERQIGRPLRKDEEVHHLCRNRTCWPPTDFHLVLMDEAIHHAIDAGSYPSRQRKQQQREPGDE